MDANVKQRIVEVITARVVTSMTANLTAQARALAKNPATLTVAKQVMEALKHKELLTQVIHAEVMRQWGPDLDRGIVPSFIDRAAFGLVPPAEPEEVPTAPGQDVTPAQVEALVRATWPGFVRDYCKGRTAAAVG